MPFKKYQEIMDKINSLDKPLSSLSRSERNQVLELSVRQEELEKEIGNQIRASFKELRAGLNVVGEWINLMEEESIKSLGVEGTPEEVMALEETLAQASSLNQQISSITLANYTAPSIKSAKFPKKVDIKAKNEKHHSPIIVSTIDIEEEKEDVVTKVLEEISESVAAAAPTYQAAFSPEVFNEPRITIQRTRPPKKKRR